jgi:hypothetical protein
MSKVANTMATPSDTTTPDDSSAGTTSRRGFLTAAAAVGVVAGTGAVSAGALQSKPSASVTFKDQKTDGMSVMVQSITMSEGGFAAIHDSSLLEGNVLGSVIGVSKKLEAGTHENVEVMLFEGVPGADFDQKMLKKDQTLIAMPHLDSNDNATYDFVTSGGKKDGPYTEGDGAVVDKAMITVKEEMMKDGDGDEKMMPSASVTFKDQKTAGNSVTVQSITMSKGGFAAIHDSSLLEGNVLGSVIGVSEKLEAGTHENVEVMLFEGVPGADFDQKMLKKDQTLIAMPHLDSNDNAVYDFITSGGKMDGPYIKNEGAVVDKAMITVKEEMMEDGDKEEKEMEDDEEEDKKKKPMASVMFEEQTSDGMSVTVQSITMSEGGFAAIHDSSLLEGNVLGSVIGVSEKLEAGTHEDVEVMLFEGVPGAEYDMSMLKEDQKLIAMPHLDTNDNATYDFITSDGKMDGPYIEGGKAVVDIACIHV